LPLRTSSNRSGVCPLIWHAHDQRGASTPVLAGRFKAETAAKLDATYDLFGLDVDAETIAVAVAESHGLVRSLGVIPNRSESMEAGDAAGTGHRAAGL
jgi:hypothetical protein